MLTYLITGIALLVVGIIIGYLVCYRNPPSSLLKKVQDKLK